MRPPQSSVVLCPRTGRRYCALHDPYGRATPILPRTYYSELIFFQEGLIKTEGSIYLWRLKEDSQRIDPSISAGSTIVIAIGRYTSEGEREECSKEFILGNYPKNIDSNGMSPI